LRLEVFDYNKHTQAFPQDLFVEGMTGLALVCEDGSPCMVGGTAQFEWGPELWIYTKEGLSNEERLRIARIAKDYVEIQLELEGKLYAHARPGNEKWLKFLGFKLQWAKFDPEGVEVKRYVKGGSEWG